MDKLPTLSYPINLAFNFKCYSILLILVYNKIWLSLAAVCPSGPCKNGGGAFPDKTLFSTSPPLRLDFIESTLVP